jgi:hypothetical protein
MISRALRNEYLLGDVCPTRINRVLALLTACLISSTGAVAGPYAALAGQVRANGGVLQILAAGGLETQSAAALDAVAIRACHTIALEGVTVAAVRIVTQNGQLLRLVSGAALAGC